MHTPQEALELINADVALAFKNPLFDKAAELAVGRFVQASLDALLERGHIEMPLKFGISFDPKKQSFFATLTGTF